MNGKSADVFEMGFEQLGSASCSYQQLLRAVMHACKRVHPCGAVASTRLAAGSYL
jgi:hypothetical protein